MDRRFILRGMGAGLIGSLLGGRLSFATVPTDKRFVLMFLRGGLDSLHTLIPYDDKYYRRLRSSLQVEEVLKVDGYFGLHPSLKGLHDLYRNRELILFPASATQYRDRSHFDGQNMLENGSGRPFGISDGWLNRAIAGLNASDERLGLSLGKTLPLILQGSSPVQTWSESRLPEVTENFLDWLSRLYIDDPIFAKALTTARDLEKPDIGQMLRRRARGGEDLEYSAKAAADLLRRQDGPRIAVMESEGWDTHFDQERRLSNLFKQISNAVLTLKSGLGPVWNQTAVLIVSEFGRTAAENGNRGTDHGTGGLAMMAGGQIRGGQIIGDWPGLKTSRLYQKRDLNPVNDYESIFKSVLISHLGLSDNYVMDQVLPGNNSRPHDGLFYSSS